MFFNGVLEHAPLSSFTWNKLGQVLTIYALGAADIMAYLHYYTTCYMCLYVAKAGARYQLIASANWQT